MQNSDISSVPVLPSKAYSMKVIILTLLIVSQTVVVDCSFLDSISGAINTFANYVSKTYQDIKDKIKEFFIQDYIQEHQRPLFTDRPVNHDLKRAFSDFIDSNNRRNVDGVEIVNTDPEILLGTQQLAFWHGRDMETHVIQTIDGYFLTLHRMATDTNLQANRTVLLHHGLLGSSTDWILLGSTDSLPYILSDAGYDVWITNARGNYYSRGHLSKQLDCSEYWKFSWQEMGEFDLPAVIDYIRQTKNFTESINFIGHSMGATALLVLLSTVPKYNEYLRIGVLLAPLAYMNNVEGPVKVMTSMSEEVIKLMGHGEFLPSRRIPSWLATKYCKGPKIFCTNPLLFLSGFHHDDRWNASFIARLLYHVPAGGSTNTLLHYMQVAYNGKFHKYNQPNSEFPLSNITLPIALISSSDDKLASSPDVLNLYFKLMNPIDHHVIRDRKLSHTDLVWGMDAKSLVFSKVIEYLEKGLNWNMMEQNEVV